MTTTTSVEQVKTQAEYESLITQLGKEVSLAHAKISRWRGQYTIRPTKILVDNDELEVGDDRTTTPLLPADWNKRFASVEGVLRRLISKRCIPIKSWTPYKDVNGEVRYFSQTEKDEHVVLKEDAKLIREEFSKLVVEQWDPLVTEFVETYPSIINDYKTTNPKKFLIVGKSFPDPTAIRLFFRASFRERPLGISKDDLTLDALNRGAGEWLDTIRTSIIKENIDNLNTAVENLFHGLEAGKLKSASITSVTAAIQMFKGFASCVDAGDLVPRLNQAEAMMRGMTSQELNASATKGLSNAADRVKAVLGNLVAGIDTESLLNGDRRQRRIDY